MIPNRSNLEDFLDELQDWYIIDKKTGPIIHYRGQTIKSIKKAWNIAKSEAGISRRLRPYDLRHYFITKALEEGGDIKAISEIVGSKPETLMKFYQHVTRKIHRETIARIPTLKISKLKSDKVLSIRKANRRKVLNIKTVTKGD